MKILNDINSLALPSQLCAILPFFDAQNRDELSVSVKGKAYGYLMSTLLCLFSVLSFTHVLFNGRDYKIIKTSQGDTEEINQTMETLFCIVSYTMTAFSCVYNADTHCRVYKDIAEIDQLLERAGFRATYEAPALTVALALVSAGVLGVAFYYVHIRGNMLALNQCVLLITYVLQMLYSSVLALYLRVVLKNITHRIAFVNQKLGEISSAHDTKENYSELRNLIEMYCRLRYIVENMNSVTGVAVLFYIGYAFYTVTNQSYLTFSTLTTHLDFSTKFDMMGLSMTWVVAEVVIMSVICSACDDIASEQRIYQINEFLRHTPKENPLFMDMKTLLFILKVSGLLPIFEQVTNYEIGPPTKSNEFYTFFIRGVAHALTVFNLYSLFTPGSSQLFYSYRDTDNINQWLELLLCIATFSGTVFISAKNAKAFVKIINEILKVDEDVNLQYGATLNNNCEFSTKFIAGLFLCQVYILILKVSDIEMPLTVTSYILIGFYGLQNAISTIFIVYTSALLRIVTIRFSYLNMVLNGYSYQQQRRRQRRYMRRVGDFAGMENFPEDSLFTFRLHNKLLRIYKSINECCSLILVAYMGYAFYTITTTTYNLFVQITTQRSISLTVVQLSFAWLVTHTSLLALLSRSCGHATKEANTTAQILARVYGKSKEYQNIIDKFLTKSIKQEVQFTAYGFFVIDNSTLFKIFSAVTTYLVILIQFKQLEDSKTEDMMSKSTQPPA